MSLPDNFFNLDDLGDAIQRELAAGITTRIVAGEQAMLSVVSFEPHSEGSIHDHPEEQWGILIEGSGTRIQGGVETTVSKGDFWLTPANVPHGFVAGPEGARVIDVFAPPRDAYRGEGAGFGA